MISTIISQRVIVGKYRKETLSDDVRRVVRQETIKHVEYDMPGRNGKIHYSYNVIESVSWWQYQDGPTDVRGAIQFGHSSQGIGDTIPDWAQ